jgi:hypothetical protein
MTSPIRVGQLGSVVLALALGLVVAGCSSGLGSPSLSAPATSSPKPTPTHKAPVTTSLQVLLFPKYGRLNPANSTVSCSAHDSTVVVGGLVQGTKVTIRLTGLRKRQHILIPPPVGSYSDRVTVTVSGASPSNSLTYVVGFASGTYQGEGTLEVNKRGTSGKLSVSAPAPEGQAPSIQSSGIATTIGGNGLGLTGTWRCP